jgi:nicotinamide-nucleotide adenylyltransferase
MSGGGAPRRAACAWDLQRPTQAHLDVLAELEEDHDELVILVTQAEQAFTEQQPASAGQRIERLLPLLRARLRRPFYLLPVKRHALSLAQYATRLRLAAPVFELLVVESPAEARAFAAALPGCSVRHRETRPGTALELPAPAPARRGLFVTRAQPFHLGHLAFVRQILAERDEVAVCVAMGNVSHSRNDPASAGERVEVVQAVLEREAPGRYHVCAAPYDTDDAANFAELRLLLPGFDAVYANSPSTRELARVEGLETISLAAAVDVSGTEVRRRIVAGEPWEDLVPAVAAEVLRRSPVLARLRSLAAPEQRGA